MVWNQKMNLTAVKEENEVIEGDLNVVDVGSGVGLPGVILAMACPSTVGSRMFKLYAIELRLNLCQSGVCLVNEVYYSSCSVDKNLDYRENFDIAVARAVEEMTEYCLPLVNVGGLFVAARVMIHGREVAKAERAIAI
ncbi:ribosomal RNA small subunit methyltransferase G-like [Salvia hispanica]|uniref:ribosomal RNA small subunit methyltransferase G-like n=1 Tax=Salvia hispanica TaxID=49212 RepID=UPI0020093DB9|nr:ribosomal RNA small subunit methyltransferase G-like [Salvia hispanica]